MQQYNMKPNIYLIGPRGSGKTTVGSLLAQKVGRPFTDLDHYLKSRIGHEISAIVAAGGWPEFRRIENLCLAECAARANQVIATGGGVVLDPANRAFLRKTGVVIWLDTPVAAVMARLAARPEEKQRPALTGLDPQAEIARIMAEREPVYRDCCHHHIDGSQTAEQVCAAIRNVLCI